MIFNPSRLAIARKRRLLNKSHLASLLGVEPYTLYRWEQSRTEPTQENLDAIVRVLKFPRAFFFGPDIDEPDSGVTSFRSQKAMSAALRDAALAAGAIGFQISDWVEERFELPQIKVPDLHLYDPEAAANALRQEWGLGEQPVSNMIQLLESTGVRVFSLAENTVTVNAYSLWRNSKPYVFLNTFKNAESSRFDAAHEIAHLVLHQDGSVSGRTAEDQAHRFASACLMPRADVLSELPRVQSLRELMVAKRRWSVSLAALNYRVHRLGLTSDWKNRDFCIEIAKRGYNKSEPDPIDKEKSVVWEKVLRTLWSEQTTQADIARELNIPVAEVADLLFGMLGVPMSQQPDPRRTIFSVVSNDAQV